MIRLLLSMVVLAALGLLAASWHYSRPAFDGELAPAAFEAMTLAPLDRAITLAQSRAGDVILVTALDAEGVRGVRLDSESGSPFANAVAAAALPLDELVARSSQEADTTLRWSELGMPVPARPSSIAAGTNYRAHAEEVGLEDGPFLFPKLSAPTPWDAPVTAGGRFDYEVELCAVTLADYTGGDVPPFGYLLCGDFTNRLQLVQEMDLGGPMGVTGFPDAKGGATRFPVGPLLVVPRDADLYRDIELELYLDARLRQRSGADKMIWPPATILANALADCETDYVTLAGPVRLVSCDGIPAGTVLLTGTPEGVMFHVTTLWSDAYYLQPGDVVTAFATYLGFTRNEIAAP